MSQGRNARNGKKPRVRVRGIAGRQPLASFEHPHDCVHAPSRQFGTTLDEVMNAAATLSAGDFLKACDTIDDVSAPNYNVCVTAIGVHWFWPDVAAVVKNGAVVTEAEDTWAFVDAKIFAVNRITGTAWALTSLDEFRSEDEPQVLQSDKLAPVCAAFNVVWREGERARAAIKAEEDRGHQQWLAEELTKE